MDFSAVGQDVARAIAAVGVSVIAACVVIAILALRGTTPEQRVAILKALPAVFRSLPGMGIFGGRDRGNGL